MATLKTVTVGPSSTYGSLETAEAAEQKDLVASDEFLEFIYEDFSDSVAATIGSGWTTDATRYIEVKPGPGNKHDGRARAVSGSGAAIEVASARALSLGNSGGAGHIRVTGMVLRCTDTNSGFASLDLQIGSWPSGSDCRITDCIIHDDRATPDTNYTVLASKTNLNVVFENCITYGNHRAMDGRQSVKCDLKQTLLYGGSDLGAVLDNTSTVENCYSGGRTSEDWWTGGTAPSGDYNASEDTSATTDYTNGINSLTASDQFVNASVGTSADFTTKTGAGIIDAGNPVSIGVATDIIGTSRPQGSADDIGAFEFIAAALSGQARVIFLTGEIE
jgi:hypothetical protein